MLKKMKMSLLLLSYHKIQKYFYLILQNKKQKQQQMNIILRLLKMAITKYASQIMNKHPNQYNLILISSDKKRIIPQKVCVILFR
ncbi:hypothetical protein FGO68_gene17815 [Halteria grandinella]|uniref:Uncharacterized protein n=1 Tax=Halteria grandinella TaxID=5974 RepID=A0A8J8NG92_HALGN|nr:hypothetical protein FGO68_gene17815 [Halteria grandinella]